MSLLRLQCSPIQSLTSPWVRLVVNEQGEHSQGRNYGKLKEGGRVPFHSLWFWGPFFFQRKIFQLKQLIGQRENFQTTNQKKVARLMENSMKFRKKHAENSQKSHNPCTQNWGFWLSLAELIFKPPMKTRIWEDQELGSFQNLHYSYCFPIKTHDPVP